MKPVFADTFTGAVDEKDPYTKGHSDRVTRYSVIIATEMGLKEEDIEKIRISAQLHDVGKIGIEDRIHNDAEALTADLHHDNEAVIDSPSLALAELENSFQIDQRQQLVAQPQHGGILDVLDAWFATTAHAHELDDCKLEGVLDGAT